MRSQHARFSLTLLLLAVSCGDSSSSSSVTVFQTSRVATHNSYWVSRGAPYDIGASGVGERLTDQLAGDGVRVLELDVHPDPSQPHRFAVYHTAAGNDVCTTLAGCLASVRLLHWAEPQHTLIAVIIELKGLYSSTFDAEHTPDDLDAELRTALGAQLWAPADLLATCAAATLPQCLAQAGWPGEDELRGRVLVAVLGNWDGLPGAVDAADWARYASERPIAQRAAFPMGSAWQRDPAVLSRDTQAALAPGEWERAWEQVAVLQVESNDDPLLGPALQDGMLVRADFAFVEAQWQALAQLGVQWWQTDWPWRMQRADSPVATLPQASGLASPEEGKSALHLDAPLPGQSWSRRLTRSTRNEDLVQALIVSPYPGDAIGCLSALSADDDAADGVRFCREKIPAAHHETASERAMPVADAERLRLSWTICRSGSCETVSTAPREDGDALRLTIRCDAQSCCAAPSALTAVSALGTESWESLAVAACFGSELPWRGFAGRAGASGVGPRFYRVD